MCWSWCWSAALRVWASPQRKRREVGRQPNAQTNGQCGNTDGQTLEGLPASRRCKQRVLSACSGVELGSSLRGRSAHAEAGKFERHGVRHT